ncbi:MAG: hypothetical protein IJ880_02555 [Bacilli bacterium]|nr:hypothetical protein [Bacilli bacterium]
MDKQTTAINEAYFGKSKKVLKIQDCFHKVREKYRDSYMKYNIEGSTEWQELKTAFEDAFGFYSVTLILGRSGIPNAYTFPISMSLDRVYEIESKVRLSKVEGLKFDPKDKFCTLMAIEECLLFDFDYTDAEITSIMLHEVGHNFQTVGYKHMVLLAFINNIFNFLIGLQRGDISGLLLFEPLRRGMLGTVNALQGTALYNVLDVISKIARYPISLAVKLVYPLIRVIQLGYGTFLALTAPLIAYSITFDGYAGENFADKYPVMLGYGVEYGNAMSKLNSSLNNIGTFWLINKTPILGHLYQLLVASVCYLGMALDPHPEYAARMMNIINTLEHDLNDRRLDPKARKQIKEDLAKIRKNMKEYMDNPMSPGEETAIAYQKWLLEKFPGYGDIRSKMLKDSDIDDDAIDKNFKNLQKVKRESREFVDTKNHPLLKQMLEEEQFFTEASEYSSPTDILEKYYAMGYTAAVMDINKNKI